ncbi:MAG: hypothetical protein ACI4F7_02820, partial [Acutalibacteraceae bacterium]
MRNITKKVISVLACVAVFVSSIGVATFSAFADTGYDGVVINGGFENGAWTEINDAKCTITTETDPKYVHSGTKSEKIVMKNNNTSTPYVNISGLTSGNGFNFGSESYALTFWAKADDFVGCVYQCGMFVKVDGGADWCNNEVWTRGYLIGGEGDGALKPQTLKNTDWVKYTTFLQIPFDNVTDFRIEIMAYGTGTVWIDDVNIEKASTVLPTCVVNGSFEDGAWNEVIEDKCRIETETDSDYVHSGYKSEKIILKDNAYSPVYLNVSGLKTGNSFDLQSGNYALTFWAKADNFYGCVYLNGMFVATNGAMSPNWTYSDWTRGYLIGSSSIYAEEPVKLKDTGWVKYQTKLELPYDNVSDIRIELRAYGTGEIWIDDVNVEVWQDTPEPKPNLLRDPGFDGEGTHEFYQAAGATS